MSHMAGATSSAALPPPRAALCSHFRIHGMFNWMLLYATTASQRWRSAATSPSSALHRRHGVARARLLRSKDVEAGIRHGGGPGAARARAARLRHSAAGCRVQNRTHAAQARLQTHVQAIEHLLTKNLRLCQNASHRTSPTAAADMKLRFAVMMYTHANTLRVARQELDRQQNQLVGQPAVEAALTKTSSSRQSSQNMPTLEHAMDLEDSLASQPFRGRTAQPTIAKMSGQREQATTRRGRLGFHAFRTAPGMRRQDSPSAEDCFLLKKEGLISYMGE